MNKKFILSIDQGTTSTRAILFDKNGKMFCFAQREINCIFPHSSWVEIDATSIWISVVDVINEVLIKANISFDDIDSIGITNQRETTIVWDKNTSRPVYNAIVWQSRQSQKICEKYSKYKNYIHKKTGLLINPYFSASKIRFILDHIPNGQKRADKGELLFGTVDSWLIYKMSKNKVHATDVTNASRTMLFNINTLSWDLDLLKLFNIPKSMLPEVLPSSYDYGVASFFKDDLHIRGVAGDQQAALFGQTCFKKGEAKNTYGTGCFMLMNTGKEPIFSKNGLITTIAWKINEEVYYALEGSIFIGGAIVQWCRDEMKLITTSAESEDEANKCSSSHGIYIVPAFVGLGTPYWDDKARGAVFGLTRSSNKHHFVRACLEAIAYQCKDVFEIMKKETNIGNDFNTLKVDGGATVNNYLMQFQSDILQCEILVPTSKELTALGAAYLAGLSSGFFPSLESISKIHEIKSHFHPTIEEKEANKLYGGWKKAVKATRMFK